MKIKQLLKDDSVMAQNMLLSKVARFRLYILKNPEAKKARSVYEKLMNCRLFAAADKQLTYIIESGYCIFSKKEPYNNIEYELIIEYNDPERERRVLAFYAMDYRVSDDYFDD